MSELFESPAGASSPQRLPAYDDAARRWRCQLARLRRLSVGRGWPAVGLLILRVAAAAAIAWRPVAHPVEVCAAILLLGGAWTTAAAVLTAGLELWRAALQSGGWISLLLLAMAVTLALMGPGGWSFDARFRGWHRIEIPPARGS